MNPPEVDRCHSNAPVLIRDHELAGIEVLRFLCALAVLIWHYGHFFFVGALDHAQALAVRPMSPAYWFLQPVYEKGWCAVQVFWCISGFIFYWRYAEQISDRRIGAIEFAARRFSRLYPLHIVTLVLVVALQFLYFRSHGQTFIVSNNSARAFLAQLFFASSWFDWQVESFNAPIWSVSVEILVYYGFFYAVRAVGANCLVAICVSGAGLALLWSGLSLFQMQTVCQCAVLFFAGGAAQLLSKRRFSLLGAMCAGAGVCALLVVNAVDFNLVVIVILAVCLVLVFAGFGEMKCGPIFRSMAFLGNATYSSYLVHFPIQLGLVIILDALGYDRAFFRSYIALVAYLAVVIVISLAVFHLLESPAQSWLRNRARSALKTPPSDPLPTPRRFLASGDA
jgi:peptidoglycan/LPS O-acetylase OafA/YrhL